ncbi:hypothetical protein SASPL_134924 [Salvia splendens]|uniref:NAD-dependent epimerase/dehydratase domain-containing protein n=1 Tax=Salvia splendens TaxID=180675 RepID=A0A8X8ZEZ1_SALSN|nr:hypothetical protein SASPL_134924 [Salvia splendens]
MPCGIHRGQKVKRLQIFEADLNHPDTFRAAIAGCIGVFLVAHQMPTDTTTGDTSTTSTLAILQACLVAKTVKRAVYTSSAVAAIFSAKISTTIDEESWSNLDLVHKSPPPVAAYAAAKTSTEKSALEFGEKHGNADSYKYLAGSVDVVHVDDVASAQIFLFESGDAKGSSMGRASEISSQKLLETGFK